MEGRPATATVSIRRLVLLVALPLLVLWAVHLFSQHYGTAMPAQVLRLTEARLLPGDARDPAQVPGALPDASGHRVALPVQIHETDAPGPLGKYADTVPVLLPRIYKTLREHRLIISGSPGFVDACMASAIALEASPENISFDRFDPVSPR